MAIGHPGIIKLRIHTPMCLRRTHEHGVCMCMCVCVGVYVYVYVGVCVN